jgi:hypothetical protein
VKTIEIGGETTKMGYRVYRFDISMTKDQERLERFLNRLEGEVVAIIPNVTPMPATYVNFLLIVEKVD